MYLSSDVTTLLRGSDGGLRLGIFFMLATEPALHVWFGVNDIEIGIPSIDPAGTKYLGGGRLLKIPDLELLLNGIASRVTFQLTGIDADSMANLHENAPPVTGAAARIGVAPLDTRWQPQTQIIPLWTGTADVWSMSGQRSESPTDPLMYSISLSLGSGDSRRASPRLTLFSDLQQRLFSATDAFCERVARYAQGLIIAWPRFK